MDKRIIVSEDERTRILEQHKSYKVTKLISEQDENVIANKTIQCFLNKKGITDESGQKIVVDGSIGNYPKSKSAQAIFKYQGLLNVTQDGVWGRETMDKMSESDKKMYSECSSEFGTFLDKIYNFFK